MPRKLRMEYPGAICHVVNRGERRKDIFKDDLDRKAGRKRPGASCGRNSGGVGGWREEELARMRKGDQVEVKLAQRLRRETTMSLKWIARRLQMGSWTYVSNLLHEKRKQ